MPTYKNLIDAHRNEVEIKKSLFVGITFPITSVTAFTNNLSRYADPQATHNCWAYRFDNEYRFSDDGEPSGTAGQPMLTAIDGAQFNAIGALVIRYYGGIKLGTGGLARAYGGTIAKNLQAAKFQWHTPKTILLIQVPFAYTQSVYLHTESVQGNVLNEEFNTQGAKMKIEIPINELTAFKDTLNNHSKGEINYLTVTNKPS